MAIEYRFKLRRRIASSADPTDLLHGEMASVEPTGGFWYGWGAGSGDLADENRLLFYSDGTRLWHDVVGASDGTTEFVGVGSSLTGVSVPWAAGAFSVGGAPNAITLTSGADLPTIPRNVALWFKATSANTGATTINIDGIGAVACRTVTGVALPAGYIRTDVQTPFWYDGTNIIVGRLSETGTNGGVEYVRFADGRMECSTVVDDTSGDWTTASGSFYIRTGGGVSVSFGVTFAAVPALQCTIHLLSATQVCGCWASNVTASGTVLRPFSNASIASGTAKSIHLTATGRWY